MNTFLVSNNHQVTARCLDIYRLNRQIIECIHLAKILGLYKIALEQFHKIPFGVNFPPVIQLWLFEQDGKYQVALPELYEYFNFLCQEWEKTHLLPHGMTTRKWILPERPKCQLLWPSEVIISHRNALLRKDNTHYSMVFKRERIDVVENNTGYVWEHPLVVERQTRRI